MSRAAAEELLRSLADDVCRVLAAGAGAADDPGLRRGAQALRSLAARVPALNSLADAAERARDGDAKSRPRALLDLNVLLRGVRAGLTKAGLGGPLGAPEPSGPWTTDLRLDEPVFTDLLPELANPKARPLNALILADHEEMGTELRLVGPLLAALGHPDKDAPRRVISVLRHFGAAVVPDLRRDFDPEGGRADAMRLVALARVDPEAARAGCRAALERGSDTVRIAALDVLQEIDPPEAERTALPLLAERSTSADLRDKAWRALRVARTDAGLDTLLAAVDEPDRTWEAARFALERCPHDEAGGRILQLAKAGAAGGEGARPGGPQRATRLMAVLLQRRDAAGLREFLSWLDHPVKELREWAREKIQYLPEPGEAAVPELVAALRHKDTRVLVGTMRGLARLGQAARAAVPRLTELLRDKRATVRSTAAATLGQVGEATEPALTALSTALRDSSRDVRVNAATALGALGPAALPALPELVEALNDAQHDVCSAALRAVGDIGPGAATALPAVLALQHHQYASVRHASLGVLARLGEAGIAQVVESLSDPARCSPMMSALSRYAGLDPAIVRQLVAILRDPVHPARARAAAVLGGLRAAAGPGVMALIEALDEGDDALREAAARALAVLTIQAKEVVTPLAESAVPALARATRNGTYRTRVDACDALRQLGAAARLAAPALTAATNDPDFIVRKAAREALRAVGGRSS